jgi:hypothetical protein
LGIGLFSKDWDFFLERLAPTETSAIKFAGFNCRLANDPSLPADRLSTKWRLWIPELTNGYQHRKLKAKDGYEKPRIR